MREYGLTMEPDEPNEAFEALADTLGDRVFTHGEGVMIIANVTGTSYSAADWQLERLIKAGNITEVA